MRIVISSPRARPGFFLLDVLLGITIFAVFVGVAGYSMVSTQNIAISSGDRLRAALLSQRSIAAVQAIRDEDFDLLVDGTYGVQIGNSGRWELSGTQNVSEDGFITSVVLLANVDGGVDATAQTHWYFGNQRTGTSSITMTLTNWRTTWEIGNWSSVALEGSYIDGGAPRFNDIVIAGDYAFVTSETIAGGAGLYVFDISNPASPQWISSSFNLGADGYELDVSGDVLFVVTSASSGEIRAYDITSPDTFSSDDLLGSLNIPGNGLARAISVFGDTAFVGSSLGLTSGEHEFYSIDVSDVTTMAILDSINDDDGGYLDIALHNGYAYIASSNDVSELILVDVFDPSDLVRANGSGYNLTDTPNGNGVAAFGTSALIGRSYGSAIQEVALFDIELSPVPSPPPGPWYHSVGADVRALDVDPTGAYAFIASDYDGQEFKVIDIPKLAGGLYPEITNYDIDTGEGRGVYYDVSRDMVFLTTTTALHVFSPN